MPTPPIVRCRPSRAAIARVALACAAACLGPALAGANNAPRETLVVLADMLHAPVGVTSQQVADVLFNGPDSVNAFYAEATYGAVSFTGQVLDPVSIPYSGEGTCFYINWAVAAQQAATAAYNVDFSQYDHVVYVLPPCPSCHLDGVAAINGRNSWNFGKPLERGIYSHELGHNFGLLHANTPGVEGGDFSSTMGYSDQMVHFSAAEKDAAGWLPLQRALNIEAEGQYRLAPLESLAGFDPLALRIDAPGSDDLYYVSYRQPVGFDANLPAMFQNHLSVHSADPAGHITLRAVLDDGEVFTDAAAGVSIRMIDHFDQFATFRYSTSPLVGAPGDFNFDGQVTGEDLAQWRLDYIVTPGSDANLDGASDGTDFLRWQEAVGYEQPVVALAAATVPEPASMVLSVVITFGVLHATRAHARRGSMRSHWLPYRSANTATVP
jgi:hypothetical protein